MIFLLIWIGIAIVCAIIAGNKGRSAVGWLFIGAIFGVFALIVVACLSNVSDDTKAKQRALYYGDAKKCPECAEIVQPDAKVCRYCGYRFGELVLGPDQRTR